MSTIPDLMQRLAKAERERDEARERIVELEAVMEESNALAERTADQFSTMRQERDAARDCATIAEDRVRLMHDRLAEVEKENLHLRAALANSKDPCLYCQLPADEMAKCRSGFPGCARADDLMGCPEFGAMLNERHLQEEVARLRKGIQDFLTGDYPNPRTNRPQDCPHGHHYWEQCYACDEAHFTKLLGEPEPDLPADFPDEARLKLRGDPDGR